MPRQSRLFIPGYPIHAIQRGHNRMQVFRDRRDYEIYLEILYEAITDFEIELHAFVLMSNHIHLLLSSKDKESLARLFQSIGRRYVQYFNRRDARRGTLWEGRYRSSTIDSERYLLEVYRYIELNPVRAGMVELPEQYKYSSYGHHAGLEINSYISDHEIFWRLGNTPFERQASYKALVREGIQATQSQTITDHALHGWHLGGKPESLKSRRNNAGMRGRPKKQLYETTDSVPI